MPDKAKTTTAPKPTPKHRPLKVGDEVAITFKRTLRAGEAEALAAGSVPNHGPVVTRPHLNRFAGNLLHECLEKVAAEWIAGAGDRRAEEIKAELATIATEAKKATAEKLAELKKLKGESG